MSIVDTAFCIMDVALKPRNIMSDRGNHYYLKTSVSMSYKVKALPQTIILDPQHKIIAAILGGVSEQELNGLLSPYLR